jgi:hypothetical protein
MAKTELEKRVDSLLEDVDGILCKVDYCSLQDGVNIPVNKMVGLILEHLGLRVASRDQYILVKKILRRD